MGLRIQPKPEDLIWDATALPADVAAGKVFYNNDGRQVGKNKMGFKEFLEAKYGRAIKAITIESGSEVSGNSSRSYNQKIDLTIGETIASYNGQTSSSYKRSDLKFVTGTFVGVELKDADGNVLTFAFPYDLKTYGNNENRYPGGALFEFGEGCYIYPEKTQFFYSRPISVDEECTIYYY